MTHRSLVLAAGFTVVAAALAHAQPKQKLPTIPDSLKPFKATVSVRGEWGPTLVLTGEEPLTPEQWAAVGTLQVRAFILNGKVSDDAGMAALARLNPKVLQFGHSPMTDAGAAHFAEMKELRVLLMSHTDKLTPKAAAALADHPALEVFANDGKFGIGGMAQIATAPKLRTVTLQHGVASDANTALLARHPALETLTLWPSGTAALTDAGIAPLATVPNLKQLTIELSVLTYDGLAKLKDAPKLAKLTLKDVAISDADLAKLKAELPNVAVTHTPMKPEYRAQWDAWAAKKK
ncbi:Uncharacterized protein OS=Chthoniobacter flavus Ellin428 GN=CfE428DRAFT_4841 PE=4 SV=1 [Gemmataceae bacterium]|nr:Uncharacterized protein OS=Chthoniobacter flavus Ellin428 GN=CfE428DRAFT_4841 PE=4 SV=1 [Gemmataceae bacterium]VTT98474.1 Uncharacterized protein OS=Chthoniobacter flavus Ellin428 GN=CfE428DRAFT_4841 PE=4 SV=1 [Gemmataceae bacterium]